MLRMNRRLLVFPESGPPPPRFRPAGGTLSVGGLLAAAAVPVGGTTAAAAAGGGVVVVVRGRGVALSSPAPLRKRSMRSQFRGGDAQAVTMTTQKATTVSQTRESHAKLHISFFCSPFIPFYFLISLASSMPADAESPPMGNDSLRPPGRAKR